MRLVHENLVAFVLVALTVALFEFNILRAGDAFLVATIILLVLTGFHLFRQEGRPFIQAIGDLLLRPETHNGPRSYWALIASIGLGVLIVAQSLLA